MQQHIPVLIEEVVSYLDPHAGEHYLDLTAGYGGHARRVLEKVGDDGHAILVDRDQNAIDHLEQVFAADQRVEIRHQDFLSASQQLQKEGQTFDLVLADIGLSSPHLDNARRGFSFQEEGPLDMRMDQRLSVTAGSLINEASREELITILQKYGEVRGAAGVVDALIAARPFETTTDLARVIKARQPNPKVRLEAQVFQALRIAVNGELDQLSQSLPVWHSLLKPGGRLAVISFHSLEDRLVKQYFQEHGGNRYDADFVIKTKQPVVAGQPESVFNPRSRSAKLRVVQRK